MEKKSLTKDPRADRVIQEVDLLIPEVMVAAQQIGEWTFDAAWLFIQWTYVKGREDEAISPGELHHALGVEPPEREDSISAST